MIAKRDYKEKFNKEYYAKYREANREKLRKYNREYAVLRRAKRKALREGQQL